MSPTSANEAICFASFLFVLLYICQQDYPEKLSQGYALEQETSGILTCNHQMAPLACTKYFVTTVVRLGISLHRLSAFLLLFYLMNALRLMSHDDTDDDNDGDDDDDDDNNNNNNNNMTRIFTEGEKYRQI